MVNHRSGDGGSVVANHHGAGGHMVVVTTLTLSADHYLVITANFNTVLLTLLTTQTGYVRLASV